MKKVIGFLMCLPMLALLVGSVYWAVVTTLGLKILSVLVSIVVCVVLGAATLLLILLCYTLLARGVKILSGKKGK